MSNQAKHSGSRNCNPRKRRVFIGGVCCDNYLAVVNLEIGRKQPILSRTRSGGGGAGNNAIGHRHLSPDTTIVLLAATANDPDGQDLRRVMAAERIDMPWVPVSCAWTSVSFALVERASGRGTTLYEIGARAVPVPLDLVEQAMPGAEACCLVAHAVNEQIPAILRIATGHQVPIFLGLGSAQIYQLGYDGLHAALVEQVELVICNRKEARDLTGREDIAEQLDALQFGGRVRTAIITDGMYGIHASREGEEYHVPAYSDPDPAVVDDVGAGDAAQGAIVDAFLRNYPLELALLAGARQGFEVCTAFGATTRLLDGAQMQEYLSMAACAAVD